MTQCGGGVAAAAAFATTAIAANTLHAWGAWDMPRRGNAGGIMSVLLPRS